MKKFQSARLFRLCPPAAALALLVVAAGAAPPPQKGRTASRGGAAAPAESQPARLLKRTTTRREVRTFGHGGTLTIYGAPEGSVTVEGWPRAQVEIVAEIESQAETEADLALLAEVNRFHLDEDFNHLRVLTLGTHDAQYLKRAGLKLPKHLTGLPWQANYRVRVPIATDLVVYAGRGGLSLSGVDGSVRLQGGGGAATFDLSGGDFEARLAGGPVTVRIPTRSWRGRGMSLWLAGGDLTVELPAGFSGNLDAEVLRAGRVENQHPGLAPRGGPPDQTDRALRARAGAGGATLSFTVGDGTVKIVQAGGARPAPGARP
ncbi:MAG TPA: hypothetical protein VEY09_06970 [Pyrinomonadaceae bacterium]|nr:hypothetical protein [Pyrinomonadaceae bacterium]